MAIYNEWVPLLGIVFCELSPRNAEYWRRHAHVILLTARANTRYELTGTKCSLVSLVGYSHCLINACTQVVAAGQLGSRLNLGGAGKRTSYLLRELHVCLGIDLPTNLEEECSYGSSGSIATCGDEKEAFREQEFPRLGAIHRYTLASFSYERY